MRKTLFVYFLWIFLVLTQASFVLAQRFDERSVSVGGKTLIWQEPKIHGNDQDPRTAFPEAIEIVRVSEPPPGVTLHLEHFIQTNRNDYELGEKISIKFYVKNTSDSEEDILLFSFRKPVLAGFLEVIDFNQNTVPYTSPPGNQNLASLFSRYMNYNRYKKLTIPARKTIQIPERELILNEIFDISQPGIYEIVFYRSVLFPKENCELLLESNKVIIEIHESQRIE